MPVDIEASILRSFTAVAEHGQFGRAAAALGISRPRLSKSMLELEEQLGYALFDREAEGTQLTDAGRQLLLHAPVLIIQDEERQRIAAELAAAPLVLRMGFMPGVTVTKWTKAWEERHPEEDLDVFPTTEADQVEALFDGRADVSFVRFPINGRGLSVVRLYAEVPVVLVPKDHPISLFEAVTVADLAGEHLLQDPDTQPEWRDVATEIAYGTRRALVPMRSLEDSIEQVAAGVGILIMPQSVARLYTRKDVVARPVTDAAETRIAIAWLADSTSRRIEEFVGIVRGRTAQSSRATPEAPAKKAPEPARSPKKSDGKKGNVKRPAPTAPGARTKRRGSR